MSLTLLVPELIWPEPADQFAFKSLNTPALSRLLGRSQITVTTAQAFENTMVSLVDREPPPLAPLRMLGDGLRADDGYWLCADPVHLRFHHERIVLADAGAFALTADEANQLIVDLNNEFSDVGEFVSATPQRWYLKLNVAVDHQVEPLSRVAGRRVDGEINDQALPLTRWLNEVQMFLHLHPVNAQRQQSGQPAINSLWLWGGGRLPAAPGAFPFTRILADNPLSTGLARWAHCPRETLSAQSRLQDGDLIIIDTLLDRVLYEDSEGWCNALNQLEQTLFAPLKNSLGKSVDRVNLIAPTIYGQLHLQCQARVRWQFWKTAADLPTLAEQLASAAHS